MSAYSEITKEYTVWCHSTDSIREGLYNHKYFEQVGSFTKKTFIKAMKSEGWKYYPKFGAWFCPECSEYEKKMEELSKGKS